MDREIKITAARPASQAVSAIAEALGGLCVLTRYQAVEEIPGMVQGFLGQYPVIAQAELLAKALDALAPTLETMRLALKGERSLAELAQAITKLEAVEAEILGGITK